MRSFAASYNKCFAGPQSSILNTEWFATVTLLTLNRHLIFMISFFLFSKPQNNLKKYYLINCELVKNIIGKENYVRSNDSWADTGGETWIWEAITVKD